MSLINWPEISPVNGTPFFSAPSLWGKSDTTMIFALGAPAPGTGVFLSLARVLHLLQDSISEFSFSMLSLAFMGIKDF